MEEFEELYAEIITMLEQKLSPELKYHDVKHTKYVIEKTKMIGSYEQVNERELYLLKIAALFHDVGFIKSREHHEAISCQIVEEKLRPRHISSNEIRQLQGMIMATKIPQNPQTHLEAILADADLEYLGTDDYFIVSEKLYKELLYVHPDLSNEKWLNIQINFLEHHTYHTAWCKANRSARKGDHLKTLRSRLN